MSVNVALVIGILSILVLTAPGQVSNGRKETNGSGLPVAVIRPGGATVLETTTPQVKQSALATTVAAGNFFPPVSYATGGYNPISVAIADINGDGKPDMVVGNQCSGPDFCVSPGLVGVLLGMGNGTFQPAVTYASGGSVLSAVAIADINGDGKPDLIAANECDVLGSCTEGLVGVLLGNGDGTFQSPVMYATAGYRPKAVAVADVDGDGRRDLLVTNLCSVACNNILPPQGSVAVLLGVGDGTFRSATTYASGGYSPLSIAVADLNGDGRPDVVVPNTCGSNGNVINCPTPGVGAVLLGNGDGTFQTAVLDDTGGMDASAVTVADVNEDGAPDLLIANCGGNGCGLDGSSSGNVAVLLGRGDGTFQAAVAYGAGGFFSITAGDTNSDGLLDIVATSFSCPKTATGCVSVFRGNGDGTFRTVIDYDSGSRATAVSVGDANGDGVADLVATHGYGNGTGLPVGTVDVLLAPTPIPYLPTTTTLYGFPHPSRTARYLAVVSTPPGGAPFTGRITFVPGGSPLISAGGAATIWHRWPGFGEVVSIYAVYEGDAHHSGSTSNVFYDTIPRGLSHLKLTSSGSPSLVGQPVTFNATVPQDGGTGPLITFYDDSVILGTVPMVNGGASFSTSSLAARAHGIRASFPGDTSYIGSYAGIVQQVNKNATTTALSSSMNPSQRKQPVTFTVTVTSGGPSLPTGNVRFLDGTTWLGSATLNSGVATLTHTFAAGTHTITALYRGDSASAQSSSIVLNQVVQ